jgi:ABC-type glycerol-3-phosphate transport system substrate-binding protein
MHDSNRNFRLTRRSFIRSATAFTTAAGGILVPRRANAATKVQFQTSAGARFGTPNAALIEDFNAEHPDIEIVMDTVPVQNYFPKLSTQVASSLAWGLWRLSSSDTRGRPRHDPRAHPHDR